MSDSPVSPTRRSILAGLALPAAAAGSLTLPAVLTPAAAAGPHPDTALLTLGARAAELIPVAVAAADRLSAADELVGKMTFPVPKKPRDIQFFVRDADYQEAIRRYEIDRVSYEARVADIEARVGLAALRDASDETDTAVWDALEDIAGTRATTLEGLAMKARLAALWRFDALRDSVLADLLAMGGIA